MLNVETGSGSASSDSYVSVAEFRTYCGNLGYDLDGREDEDLEQALRRGTRGIDGLYGPRFIGAPVSVAQALEWPRIGAVWRGSELPSDQIPQKVKDAASEAAWRELNDPGSLAPDLDRGGHVKRERVEGAVEVEYMDSAPAETTFSAIEGLLNGLVRAQTGTVFGFVARA